MTVELTDLEIKTIQKALDEATFWYMADTDDADVYWPLLIDLRARFDALVGVNRPEWLQREEDKRREEAWQAALRAEEIKLREALEREADSADGPVVA